jgi:hypothetical protein
MYDLNQYPTDHYFWEFLAYCTGTGGSALIIGSAAGVAAMGMEKISFFWYLKKISLLALLGYFCWSSNLYFTTSNIWALTTNDKNSKPLTHAIANKGFRGIRSFVVRFNSS